MNRQEQAVFLLNTFREEVETHVANLTRVLLDLEEAQTGNVELVRDAMRILHTVKGAARMMGFMDITRLAHAMENIVGVHRATGGPIDRDTTNLLFEGLNSISALAKTATARAMAEAANAENADSTNPMGWLPTSPPSEELETLIGRMEQQMSGDAQPIVAPEPEPIDQAPFELSFPPAESAPVSAKPAALKRRLPQPFTSVPTPLSVYA